VLIHWKGQSAASATWEDVADFRDKFPQFQLEDELDVEGGGRDVMYGQTYRRRRDITSAAERAAHATQEGATVSGQI
jgi:transcriptional regulator GlxA family with amidase domain